eukprot:TRINITY_DN3198_c0_g1_i1.p1 TRINITY_DN3198_c0_g1~~TRINITY_DN3198_c0_g1_i1.p1  ORF type:complete len:1252 (+),score=411.71 TRINITY_DN3198_c0_g1_i1:81-3758(+)
MTGAQTGAENTGLSSAGEGELSRILAMGLPTPPLAAAAPPQPVTPQHTSAMPIPTLKQPQAAGVPASKPKSTVRFDSLTGFGFGDRASDFHTEGSSTEGLAKTNPAGTIESAQTALMQPTFRRKYTLSALPLDERRGSAAQAIQEFWAHRRAMQHMDDERAWAAFVALDDAHEALTVQRIERRQRLRELIPQDSVPEVAVPRALPSLTNASLEGLIQGLRDGATIGSMADAIQIVKAASLALEGESAIPRVEAVEPDGQVIVVGDIHGNLDDLLYILNTHGMPGPSKKYVFNGDLVDRGPMSCEVLLLVLALKLSTPEAVFINRGNHEDRDVNVFYGFLDECLEKFDHTFFEMCQECFDWLPLACVVAPCSGCSVLVIHGGLPGDETITLGELAAAGRGPEVWRRPTDRLKRAINDITWSDPGPAGMVGRRPNTRRGKGILWGRQVTREFLRDNGLSFMIRSHEAVKRGYRSDHGGLCHTVFSASDYSGSGNCGAVIVFTQGQTDFEVRSWELFNSELPADLRQRNPVGVRNNQKKQDPIKLLVSHLCDYVAENRAALEAYWGAVDAAGTGLVRFDDWVAGLRAELHIAADPHVLHNRTLLPQKCRKGDKVLYHKFLDHHEPSLHASHRVQRWHDHIVADLRNKLAQSAMGLEQVFKAFDKDGDGVLQYSEFKEAVRRVLSLDVLSDSQLESLAVSFDLDGDGLIDVAEFCERLSEEAAEEPGECGEARRFVQLQWARDRRAERLKAVGARGGLRRGSVAAGAKDGGAAGPALQASEIEDKLREFDKDGDGMLSRTELAAALASFGYGYDDQVLEDVCGLTAAGPSALRKQRNSLEVDKVAIKHHIFRGGWWSGAMYYGLRVSLPGGGEYDLERRYREFDALRQHVERLRSKRHSGLPSFPPKRFTRPTGAALNMRQRGLESWLSAVVQEAAAEGAAQPFVQSVRRFLGGDSPAMPRARRGDDAKLPIPALAAAFAAPDATAAGNTVGRQMLSVLYRYRSELGDLPGIGLKPNEQGMVPVARLREALQALNELEGSPLTRAQIHSLLSTLDHNGDGMVLASDLQLACASETPTGAPLVRRQSFAPQSARGQRQELCANGGSAAIAVRGSRSPVHGARSAGTGRLTPSLRRQSLATSHSMRMSKVDDGWAARGAATVTLPLAARPLGGGGGGIVVSPPRDGWNDAIFGPRMNTTSGTTPPGSGGTGTVSPTSERDISPAQRNRFRN